MIGFSAKAPAAAVTSVPDCPAIESAHAVGVRARIGRGPGGSPGSAACSRAPGADPGTYGSIRASPPRIFRLFRQLASCASHEGALTLQLPARLKGRKARKGKLPPAQAGAAG